MLLFVFALIGGVAYVATEPRRRIRRRMDGLGLQRAGGGSLGGGGLMRGLGSGGGDSQVRQKRIQEKLRELERDKANRARRRNNLKLSLLRAGVNMTPGAYVTATIMAGIVSAGAALLFGLQPIVAGGIGLTVALGLPRMVLKFLAGRRQKAFTAEFPNAIDVLVRGVQSGLPVSECVSIVGREVPDPVGAEFRMMVEGQRVGMTLTEIMSRGLERMPTPEYKFFAIVLQIQQQTGGNLAETLSGLSNVIRERKQLRSKIKAMSSEAKTSAGIIGALPIIVAVLVSIVAPDYLAPLFETRTGNLILFGCLAYMGLGVAVMAKMINFKL
ncbi:tight adherence protein B [Rhodospira trueperi]|uniref:Tight adherence protein B n=2 Tax=Rhodospira trueperi TaxID=69960 RepID=A0A1G7DZC3_9PROT|nr:tight adherence protein B [Rhodospira trueperi]